MKQMKLSLKDLMLYAAVGLLCFTVFFGGRNYKQRLRLAEEVTRIEIINQQLLFDVAKRDSLLVLSDSVYSKLQVSYIAKDNEFKALKKKEAKIIADKNKLIKELEKISSDSSYKFLQDSVYISSIQPKTYGFDSVQVKEIHGDYISKVYLEKTNSILSTEVFTLLDKNSTCDSMLKEKVLQNSLLKSNVKSITKVADNNKKESELYKEDAEKNGKRKTFWQIVAGALGVLAVGLAL